MWKQFVKDYLSFSAKSRSGTFILLIIIVLTMLLPLFFQYFIHKKESDPTKFKNEIAQLKARTDSSKIYVKTEYDNDHYKTYHEPEEEKYISPGTAEEFYFDPNNTSGANWKRLGIKDKTIETIQKYLSKGGHFYKPEDIGKIWGFRQADVQRLLPYVTIKNEKREYEKKDYPAENNYQYSNSNFPKKYIIQNVEINSADTTSFIALPGIGSKLASRIVSFRDKLGGFNSIDQIHDVYGLPDSTFLKIQSYLTVNNKLLKQININTALLDEMKAHPYIRYAIANAIIQYRNQHGNFSSVEEIKKIMIVTDDVYIKMFPYLTAEK